MNLDRTDVIRYMYILGILVTGVFLERLVGQFGKVVVLGTAVIAGFGWLWYYKWSIAPRIESVLAAQED